MNKKGQTLILFVLLIPILILLLAFVVDTGLILKEHTKLNSTMKTIIKTTYEKRREEDYSEIVKDLFLKNNIPIEKAIITADENTIHIQNEYEKESIFGKIIGIKTYKVKNSLKGLLRNNEIKIEKE